MLVLLAGCASRQDALVRFDPTVGAGIEPEMIAEEGRGDYALRYVLSPDGSRVQTRFLGPSEALSAGLRRREMVEGSGHELIAAIGDPEYRVTLARWRLDANGRATDIRVRTEPVVEIRPSRPIDDGELVAPCEWRPWVGGRGVGPWR